MLVDLQVVRDGRYGGQVDVGNFPLASPEMNHATFCVFCWPYGLLACFFAYCCGSSATSESISPITRCCNATARSVSGVGVSAGENVTVRFHGQTVTTQADPIGYWEAWLKPESAGGPYTLTVSGDSTPTPLERKDILVGDVWLASGQSNMEFPLAGFTGTIPAPLKGWGKGDCRSQPSAHSLACPEKGNLHRPPQRRFGRVDGMHTRYSAALLRRRLLFWP